MSPKLTKQMVCPSMNYFLGECYPGDHYTEDECDEARRQQERWFKAWKRSVPRYILAFRILNEIHTRIRLTREEREDIRFNIRSGKIDEVDIDKKCPYEENFVLKISDFLNEFEIGITSSEQYIYDGINECIALAGVDVNDVETVKEALVSLEKTINERWGLRRCFLTVDIDKGICIIDVKKYLGEELFEKTKEETKLYMEYHGLFAYALQCFGGYRLRSDEKLYNSLTF